MNSDQTTQRAQAVKVNGVYPDWNTKTPTTAQFTPYTPNINLGTYTHRKSVSVHSEFGAISGSVALSGKQ